MRNLSVKTFQYVISIVIILYFFTLTGCNNELERLEDYLVEFATVIKQGTNYIFKLDNGTILTPAGSVNFNGDTGDRVILNWIPTNDNIVNINRVSAIYTGNIQNEGYPNLYVNDPVKIQSIWVGGEYLNMILEIEYHSIQHSIGVLRDMESQSTDLYFAHSSNNDPKGYPQIMYASFLISSLRNTNNTTEMPFNLYINTDKGIRHFQLTLK